MSRTLDREGGKEVGWREKAPKRENQRTEDKERGEKRLKRVRVMHEKKGKEEIY